MATRSTKTARSTKKPTAKRVQAKPARKPRAKKAVALMFKPQTTKMSKVDIVNTLVENVEGIDKKQARAMLDTMGHMILASMHPKSVEQFTIPGVLNVRVRHIAPRKVKGIKAGTEVYNPLTKETKIHEGRRAYTKPASRKIRARALGTLKAVAL